MTEKKEAFLVVVVWVTSERHEMYACVVIGVESEEREGREREIGEKHNMADWVAYMHANEAG